MLLPLLDLHSPGNGGPTTSRHLHTTARRHEFSWRFNTGEHGEHRSVGDKRRADEYQKILRRRRWVPMFMQRYRARNPTGYIITLVTIGTGIFFAPLLAMPYNYAIRKSDDEWEDYKKERRQQMYQTGRYGTDIAIPFSDRKLQVPFRVTREQVVGPFNYFHRMTGGTTDLQPENPDIGRPAFMKDNATEPPGIFIKANEGEQEIGATSGQSTSTTS